MLWTLLKESDGERGEGGGKKFYTINLEGNVVTVTWGMFKKGCGGQSKVREFPSSFLAGKWANDQRHAKRDKGYDLLMSV